MKTITVNNNEFNYSFNFEPNFGVRTVNAML